MFWKDCCALRFAVSDVVTRGEIPGEIRKNVLLWAGCVAGALDELALAERGEHDHRSDALLSDHGRGGDPVHLGHLDIQDYHIIFFALHLNQALHAISGFVYVVFLKFQDIPQGPPDTLFIVYYEDFGHVN